MGLPDHVAKAAGIILEKLEKIDAIERMVASLQAQAEREHPEYLDYKGAARHVKLGVTTLQQAVSAGTIPHYKVGAAVRFARSELDEWMVSKRVDIGGRSGKRKNAQGDRQVCHRLDSL